MNRTLIKLGPISIYWYSVMIALGFLAAMVVCLTEVKRKKLDIEKYSNMVFYAVLFGISKSSTKKVLIKSPPVLITVIILFTPFE